MSKIGDSIETDYWLPEAGRWENTNEYGRITMFWNSMMVTIQPWKYTKNH